VVEQFVRVAVILHDSRTKANGSEREYRRDSKLLSAIPRSCWGIACHLYFAAVARTESSALKYTASEVFSI